MSAPPFFQSAGQGYLKFWGEDDRPTVVVWESLSEPEQEQWSKKMSKLKDWVVWCSSRKKDKGRWKRNLLRPPQASQPQSRREDREERNQRAVSTLESVVVTGQHQMRSERRVCLVLGSPRLPCGRRAKSSVEESNRSIRRKRRMSSAIERERTRLMDGHRDRHASKLWVSGPSNGKRRFRQTRQNGSRI